MNQKFDFLIVGAGFGGCLMGQILQRLGYQVLIVDAGSHPRFAIGESSTPLADAKLAELCERFRLPEITPLSQYGSAKRQLPQLTIGLKRGFSYFRQRKGKSFAAVDGRVEQLVVAASGADATSDTHWLRSDIDHFFAQRATAEGISLWERTTIECIERESQLWRVDLRNRSDEHQTVTASFLIDASGRAGAVASLASQRDGDLEETPAPYRFRTDSRALFGHFVGVTPWHDVLNQHGIATDNHPFNCDNAALHHILDGGWIWNLRFDNGITSVGVVLDGARQRSLEQQSAERQFWEVISGYPSIAKQMTEAQCVAPKGGIQATPRMQFLRAALAGRGWACLPSAAGFVDPLHSTGIAHTLYAIGALADIFAHHEVGSEQLAQKLVSYARGLRQEFSLIDDLVAAAYLTNADFDAFVSATMLYFAAATSAERVTTGESSLFLNSGNQPFRSAIDNCLASIGECRSGARLWGELPAIVRQQIEPFNIAGLADDSLGNIYRHTVAPIANGKRSASEL